MGGNECFQLATTLLGGEWRQRDEPKVDKKLSLGVIFSCILLIMALNVRKFLTETIQAMAMAKNIALLAAGHRYQSTPVPPNPETNDTWFNPPVIFSSFPNIRPRFNTAGRIRLVKSSVLVSDKFHQYHHDHL